MAGSTGSCRSGQGKAFKGPCAVPSPRLSISTDPFRREVQERKDNFCRAVNISWPYVDQKLNGKREFHGPILRNCVFHYEMSIRSFLPFVERLTFGVAALQKRILGVANGEKTSTSRSF